MQKITTFLWFENNAEEAANFYVSIFRNAKIKDTMRAGPGGPVMSVDFQLEGQDFSALNGRPAFTFNEAISLFISCETQAEVDTLWNKLVEGGKPSQCGWLKDKFGLSWQVIPTALGRLLRDKDPEKSQRVMQAMLKMSKIEVAELERAYRGEL